jgi:hypothetical protein
MAPRNGVRPTRQIAGDRMKHAIVFALCAVVVPSMAIAQSDPMSPSTPASEYVQVLPPAVITSAPPAPFVLDSERPPGLQSETRAASPSDIAGTSRRSRVGRVLVEAVSGAGAGFGGVVLGGLAGGFAGLLVGPGESDVNLMPLIGAATGAAILGTVGLSLGVWGAGLAMDGNGGIGWTFLGSSAGVATAMLGTFASNNGVVATALFATLPLAGALLGYELSSSDSRRDTEAREHERHTQTMARAQIAPTFSGTSLGLVGTF